MIISSTQIQHFSLNCSSLENQQIKNYLKLLFKVALTATALYIVGRKIDLPETKQILFRANAVWLFAALLLFNASKVLSAVRLNRFFSSIGLQLSQTYNLRLYYVGMFYNLFLPGGIGGDGYKVYLLNRKYNTGIKPLVSATLLDRLSGMVALVFLAGLLAFAGSVYTQAKLPNYWQYLAIIGQFILLPLFYMVVKRLFSSFYPDLHTTNLQAFGVQLLQLLCCYCILCSLDISSGFVFYLFLFLLSSVVAVLPFTVGGVGARELVMIMGYTYLPINPNSAVAFSLLFFLITALSSFIGAFLQVDKH